MIQVANDSVTIANRLRPALLRLARELRREVHSLGVTGGQVSLLAQIAANPLITASELAKRERISAPGIFASARNSAASASLTNRLTSARAAVVLGGPAANILFAILLLTGVFYAAGEPYSPAIVAVQEDGPAAKAGLQPGNIIFALDGAPVTGADDLVRLLGGQRIGVDGGAPAAL